MPRKKKEELPQIGDFCYLVTDSERQLRQVISVKAEPDGVVQACLWYEENMALLNGNDRRRNGEDTNNGISE